MTALDLPVRTHPDERKLAVGTDQRRRRRRREYGLFALLVAPNLLVIAVFAYWPIIYNAFLSLTDWNMIAARPKFVGLANYGPRSCRSLRGRRAPPGGRRRPATCRWSTRPARIPS